ncbi:DUF1566 domain-containing protein [candidate division KSB1 bacterium]|nr:DUF1566 domain-containing protein [candidate division KSB1 bacterium]
MDFRNIITRSVMFILLSTISNAKLYSQSYKIVDTGQTTCYGNITEISAPIAGSAFYGQDAQYNGYQPSYTDNGDGAITDNVSGLMWSKSPDLNGNGVIDAYDKLSYDDALVAAETLNLAGYNDWRIPSTKEFYSLIMFYGIDPSGYDGSNLNSLVPFINTDNFDFGYGDTQVGERIIDAQFVATTIYKGTVMGGQQALFGVNFADGRIKGYPIDATPNQPNGKTFYILFVRGNAAYGINDFSDNGDGTITDNATGLMWAQADNSDAVLWQDALAWVQLKNNEYYLGHNDWRLPNVKELQSIVDYTRSPSTTNSAAINPLFTCSTIIDEGGNVNYPFYWSSTTHVNIQTGNNAAYVAFGDGLGWMQDPVNGSYQLMDVHGAGCQRSDPKTGDPASYPHGHGPQGDVIRIYNYVRLVRDADLITGVNDNEDTAPASFSLNQNFPNPFNPVTTILFSLTVNEYVTLEIFNMLGEHVATLANRAHEPGTYNYQWQAVNFSSGIYFYRLSTGSVSVTKRMILMQ